MYVLLQEPSDRTSKEAFEVLDETFGSGSFTEGQAINVISLALEIDTNKARSRLSTLLSHDCIGEE